MYPSRNNELWFYGALFVLNLLLVCIPPYPVFAEVMGGVAMGWSFMGFIQALP